MSSTTILNTRAEPDVFDKTCSLIPDVGLCMYMQLAAIHCEVASRYAKAGERTDITNRLLKAASVLNAIRKEVTDSCQVDKEESCLSTKQS